MIGDEYVIADDLIAKLASECNIHDYRSSNITRFARSIVLDCIRIIDEVDGNSKQHKDAIKNRYQV